MRPAFRPLAACAAALVLALAGCAAAPRTSGDIEESVTVYAAASLSGAFDRIADAFMREHPGVAVSLVYDGSATLATQIAEGAPADVVALADEATMAKVGDAAPAPEPFATNTLVLAVPSGNPAGVDSLADLARGRVVLCAPEVPCGAASARLLANEGVTVAPASLEQNVTAVLTKVAAGEADAGLVYATDVRGADDVEVIVPEGAAEVVNRYPIAVLTDAPHPAAADAFTAFVTSPAGQDILAAHGFGAP